MRNNVALFIAGVVVGALVSSYLNGGREGAPTGIAGQPILQVTDHSTKNSQPATTVIHAADKLIGYCTGKAPGTCIRCPPPDDLEKDLTAMMNSWGVDPNGRCTWLRTLPAQTLMNPHCGQWLSGNGVARPSLCPAPSAEMN